MNLCNFLSCIKIAAGACFCGNLYASCDAMRSTFSASELFAVVASGKVRINVNRRFALKYAADAHKSLEARVTSGSTIPIIQLNIHRSLP